VLWLGAVRGMEVQMMSGSLDERQEDSGDQEVQFEDDGEGLYGELQEPVNGDYSEQQGA